MADDPTEAVIRREILAARRILREDRLLAGVAKLIPAEEPAEPPADPDKPTPPPRKDPVEPPKRTSVWWGEQT